MQAIRRYPRGLAATLAVYLCLYGQSGLFGQEEGGDPVVTVGSRVRIHTRSSSNPLVGRMTAITGGHVYVQSDPLEPAVSVSHASIERVDLSLGSQRGHWIPTATGFVVGFGIGMAEAIRINSEPCNESGFFGELCDLNDLAWFAPVMFGSLGGLTGYLLSLLIKTERWEEAALPEIEPVVSVLPGQDRPPAVTVGLRLRM